MLALFPWTGLTCNCKKQISHAITRLCHETCFNPPASRPALSNDLATEARWGEECKCPLHLRTLTVWSIKRPVITRENKGEKRACYSVEVPRRMLFLWRPSSGRNCLEDPAAFLSDTLDFLAAAWVRQINLCERYKCKYRLCASVETTASPCTFPPGRADP